MNKPVSYPSPNASEAALELQIETKGLIAPRMTPADIDAAIANEEYHVFPYSTVTVCMLTLRNGAKVLGHNYGAIDSARQDWKIGYREARAMAVEKVWELEGYLLREQLDAARLHRRPNPAHGAPKPAGHRPVA